MGEPGGQRFEIAMSAAEGKTYAAVPARAIGDKRLSAEDCRVLMVVAIHDRLGANGIGCYAGHPRLADLVGCHEKSLSRSLAWLRQCGYIEISNHPLNGRQRVYRVLYTEWDNDYFRSKPEKGSKSATQKSGPKQVAELLPNTAWNGNSLVAGKVASEDKNSKENQHVSSGNIFSETEIDPVKREIHPAEAARLPRGSISDAVPGKSLGAMLGIIERKLQHGMNGGEAKRQLAWIDRQLDSGNITLDTDYQRAIRLRNSLTGRSDAA
ncbi:helix-turn-helix domain-containing protein [Mesorhizobium sp. AR10]|uniref:helix-turn-helix domain-containing protein n=1 Tax=Mesorhizobium sp. AR10 TaxID=2865839 RepID=UPI00215F950A|nr:helix-turn-helix domain-containing protein [Mesorhizobium sp. AR10]UVK40735.1 helix-turn-helix domain-containing protein [Mesorhizobium sp. AR10]